MAEAGEAKSRTARGAEVIRGASVRSWKISGVNTRFNEPAQQGRDQLRNGLRQAGARGTIRALRCGGDVRSIVRRIAAAGASKNAFVNDVRQQLYLIGG